MEELLRTTAERAAAGLKDRGVAPTPRAYRRTAHVGQARPCGRDVPPCASASPPGPRQRTMSSAAWEQCFGSRRFDIELDRAVAELDSSHVRHAIARTCAETQTRSRAVTEATHGAVEDLHVLGLERPQLGGFETGFWRRSRLLGTIPLTMTKNPKEAMRFPGPGG